MFVISNWNIASHVETILLKQKFEHKISFTAFIFLFVYGMLHDKQVCSVGTIHNSIILFEWKKKLWLFNK